MGSTVQKVSVQCLCSAQQLDFWPAGSSDPCLLLAALTVQRRLSTAYDNVTPNQPHLPDSASGWFQASQELYCVEGCGIPKPAAAVVQERATALAAAQRLGQEAAGALEPCTMGQLSGASRHCCLVYQIAHGSNANLGPAGPIPV